MRTLTLLCITLCFSSHAFAQDNLSATQKLLTTRDHSLISRMGPEVSFGVSSLEGNPGFGGVGRSSYSVGGAFEIGRSSIVFDSGLLYRQLGDNGSVEGTSIGVNLSYLSVLLGAKYYITENSFFVKVGVLPSMAVVRHLTVSEQRYTALYQLEANKFDLQWVAGLGKKFDLSKSTNLQAMLTYLRGLNSVADRYEIYNSAVLATVAVYLEK